MGILLLDSRQAGTTHFLTGNSIDGVCVVTADLAVFNVEDLLGVLSLVDPTYAAELASTPFNAATYAFVKKVVKGLLFVHADSSSPPTITCEVRTGDGLVISYVTNVCIKTIASGGEGLITVTSGTVIRGNGTQECWLQTNADGTFVVTISGSASRVAMMTVSPGATIISEIP